MPRKAEGLRPLTEAERSARKRQRKADKEAENNERWRRVLASRTLREAHAVAAEALHTKS